LSIEDKYDEVRQLINIGKEKGYLLYDEVNELLPSEITSSEELDDLFNTFGSAGIEVLDAASGKVVHTVAKLPLFDGLPTGNDAVPTGVREIAWRTDAPATLAWVEALDGGDPARVADFRDAIKEVEAPARRSKRPA